MPLINNFRYRPEIDGLRAIAVLAVVLFHAEFGCPGGYIGVDVFFVISGFLITSLIWKDLESGRFSMINFWERRARRIVPALVVVTLAVLVAGWFLLWPTDFENLGKASASQTIFAANIYYWRNSGYFAWAANEKPLLHTWSLAVEEQFYLVVPGLLWLVFLLHWLRTRKGVVGLLLLVWVLSFVLSVYGVARSPTLTFYLLPTRAWELLTGSLLAFVSFPIALARRQYAREVLASVGLALIVIPIFVYTQATPFPGVAALAPCLGAALFIWANTSNASTDNSAIPPSFLGKCLAWKPIVFIGLISYSLYLWHWPFLAFGHYSTLVPLSAGYRAAIVGLGFFCAILSWKFVETPFRERRIGASRKSMFAFAGAGLSAVFVLGLICVLRQGFPAHLSVQAQKFVAASTDMAFINELMPTDVRAGRLVKIGVADPKVRPTILVWGDSHAMAALPAIDEFLKEKGRAGRAATHSSTPPILGWEFTNQPNLTIAPDLDDFNNAVFSDIQSQHYRDVMLIARWSAYAKESRYTSEFDAALLKTVQSLVKIGSRPIILLDTPDPGFDVPKALWLSTMSRANIESLYKKPSRTEAFDYFTPDALTALRAAGAEILNPKTKFLDSTKQRYIIEKEGIVLYRDSNHLSVAGAIKILLPYLREQNSLGK